MSVPPDRPQGNGSGRPTPEQYLDNFTRRILQDALAHVLADQWDRRARDFEFALSRSGDFHGRATAGEIAEHDRRNRKLAAACRQHAAWLRKNPPEFAAEISAVLDEYRERP